jgi:CubicO group peptidase (beta-lactamase class C family)
MVSALEREVPMAMPGVQRAYHPVTMGYLLGEVVRRVTGGSIGAFFNSEIAAPHALEYWIGLPRHLHARCAEIGGDVIDTIFGASLREPETILGRAMRQVVPDLLNDSQFRSAEIPSINGHSNARAIAKLYGLLAGRDGRVLSSAALQRAIGLQWSGVEQTMGHHRNMAMGFILKADNVPMGPGPRVFGHPGAGGSIGFGDPDRELGVCFTTNRLYAGSGLNPRMIDVCNAVFRATAVRAHHAS